MLGCNFKPERKFYYSMVVDCHPLHSYQVENVLFTLERYGEVRRDSIVLQCTERVPREVRNELTKNRYTVTLITPYLDGKYCNKITQLDYFIKENMTDACGVFLLDLDLVILSPIDVAERDHVLGKIVDGPNPPLPILERIFAEAGVDIPGIVPCDWGTGETISTNFNGGFLYVPMKLVPCLQPAWRRWAEFLYARPELFDRPGQRHHTDQISFCLALAAEKIPYRHLSANWNFPLHRSTLPQSFRPDVAVRVLHYHRCLDTFGLIDPVFKDSPVIKKLVRRVNAAIGERDESMFFDLYKHHLAQEIVSSIPLATSPLFSEDFLARTQVGNKKRRLVLHAGTPKTGTTSLQWHLASNRHSLAEQGYWYPQPPESSRPPKHQQLVGKLRSGDEAAFKEYIEGALRDMPENTHSIIFTTEGIFNHWWDYTSKAKGLLRQLADLFDFELCIWFRKPESFAAALYAQNIWNPETEDKPRNVYGRDIDFVSALQDEWFRLHLDYLGFYYETQGLFGVDRVKFFFFTGDTTHAFMTQYGINCLPANQQRWNIRSCEAAIHIMRAVNRVTLSWPERRQVVDLVKEIDRLLGKRDKKFSLSEQEQALVAQYARRGWNILQRQDRNLRAATRREGVVSRSRPGDPAARM